MSKRQEIQQKSRLGTLLLHKGLINRRQLDEALTLQSSSKLMLGEIMVRQGWISEKDLNKAITSDSKFEKETFKIQILKAVKEFSSDLEKKVE
ncbi:MAG: hypothetical protein VW258_14475 [Thalassolituus sp.]